MSEVMIIVEGKTEELFVQQILSPKLAEKGIYLYPTQISKKGQKGGDVKFSRVKVDIRNHLKQRTDTFVTTFVDYYGLKEWPGLDSVPEHATPEQIAEILNKSAMDDIKNDFPQQNIARRFIPFVLVHEFEALLFSDPSVLSKKIGISSASIERVLVTCGGPESVNNSRETAPSKRLASWMAPKKYGKILEGISIAKEIGLEKIRSKCGLFNNWINRLEHCTNL